MMMTVMIQLKKTVKKKAVVQAIVSPDQKIVVAPEVTIAVVPREVRDPTKRKMIMSIRVPIIRQMMMIRRHGIEELQFEELLLQSVFGAFFGFGAITFLTQINNFNFVPRDNISKIIKLHCDVI